MKSSRYMFFYISEIILDALSTYAMMLDISMHWFFFIKSLLQLVFLCSFYFFYFFFRGGGGGWYVYWNKFWYNIYKSLWRIRIIYFFLFCKLTISNIKFTMIDFHRSSDMHNINAFLKTNFGLWIVLFYLILFKCF